MKQTIQQLREEHGESRSDLAAAIGITLDEVAAWELGQAEPAVFHLRALAEHFDVRDDQINLRPHDPPTLGDRLEELF
jgi:transcriptional regulator with XRE-family HTH domain